MISKSASLISMSWKLLCPAISDNPRLEYRGTHLDSGRSDGFRNDREALMRTPFEKHICSRLVELFGDLLDFRRVEHSGFASGVVAQWRVGSNDDALVLAWLPHQRDPKRAVLEAMLTVLEQLGLLKLRMGLDLIDLRNHSSSIDQHLQYLNRAVGHSDSLDLFGLLVDPDDLFPRLDEGRSIIVHRSVTVLVQRLEDISRGKGGGPVDEPNVKVVQLQLLESSVEVTFASFGSVIGIPEFGDYGELFSGDAAVLDALSDLIKHDQPVTLPCKSGLASFWFSIVEIQKSGAYLTSPTEHTVDLQSSPISLMSCSGTDTYRSTIDMSISGFDSYLYPKNTQSGPAHRHIAND